MRNEAANRIRTVQQGTIKQIFSLSFAKHFDFSLSDVSAILLEKADSSTRAAKAAASARNDSWVCGSGGMLRRVIDRRRLKPSRLTFLPFEWGWEIGKWGHRRRRCGIRRFHRKRRLLAGIHGRRIRPSSAARSGAEDLGVDAKRRWRGNGCW